MRAEEALSTVCDPKEAIGTFDRDQLQKVAFEVMIAYGLNLDISKPEYTSGGFDDYGVSRHKDGTSRQFLNYPSQTIPGLIFQRWLDSYTETGTPIYVAWSAIGQKRPFREHFKDLLPKLLKPARIEI